MKRKYTFTLEIDDEDLERLVTRSSHGTAWSIAGDLSFGLCLATDLNIEVRPVESQPSAPVPDVQALEDADLCAHCDGSGVAPDGLACWTCGGSGSVGFIDPLEDDEDAERFFREIAARENEIAFDPDEDALDDDEVALLYMERGA